MGEQAGKGGGFVPESRGDWGGVLHVAAEHVGHLGSGGFVFRQQGEFKVKVQRAFIEVCGADGAGCGIGHADFFVQEAGFIGQQADAGGQHAGNEGEHGEAGGAIIASAGDEHAYINPAHGGGAEGGADGLAGHQVWAGQPEALLSARRQFLQAELPIVDGAIFRPAGNKLALLRAGRRAGGGQVLQVAAGGAAPVVQKAQQALRDNGALQKHKGIAPVGAGGTADVFNADIEAAEVGLAAVDDNELAVVAEIEAQHGAEPEAAAIDGGDLHPGAAQAAQITCRQFQRADFIVDDIDLHPGAGAFLQCFAQGVSHAVVADDEEFHQDAGLRMADGLEQLGIGIVPILQQADMVAATGRVAGAAGQGSAKRAVAGEPGIVAFKKFLNAFAAVSAGGVAVDAGRTQHEIQGNGEQGKQKQAKYPRNGALG